MKESWLNYKDSLHIKKKGAITITGRKGKSHVVMRGLQIPEKISKQPDML